MTTREEQLGERLREEHELLGDAQKALVAAVAAARGAGAGPQAGLASAIRAFAGHLVRHFDYEEAEGYLAPEIERRPTDAPVAEALLRQHEGIRADLVGLLSDLDARLADPEERTLLLSNLREVLIRLQAHESSETSLVLDVFWTEEGTGD